MGVWITKVQTALQSEKPALTSALERRRSYQAIRALIGAALLDQAKAPDDISSGTTLVSTQMFDSNTQDLVTAAIRTVYEGRIIQNIDGEDTDQRDIGLLVASHDDYDDLFHRTPNIIGIGGKDELPVMFVLTAQCRVDIDRHVSTGMLTALFEAVTGVPAPFTAVSVEGMVAYDLTEILRLGLDLATALGRLHAWRQAKQQDEDGKKPVKPKDEKKEPDPVPIAVPANVLVKKLSKLHGFGVAREWAMQLADDIKLYGKGDLTWDDVDTGMLCVGPPGSGKTTLAAALAAEAGCQFVSTSFSDWEGGAGGGYVVKAMAKAFDKWREMAKSGPVLVFIDEIDSLGARGANGHNDSYWAPVINALLAFLDGATPRNGVFVMAATNYEDRVDPALRRPGRLERVVEIPYPTLDEIPGIVKHHLGIKVALSDVTMLRGTSPAVIMSMCKDARRTARKAKRKVTVADLRTAWERIKKPRTADEERRIAIHESGHAVAAVALGLSIVGVGIDFAAAELRKPPYMTPKAMESRIAVSLAGRAAEYVIYDDVSDGAQIDLAHATADAQNAITRLGFGKSLMSREPGMFNDREIDEMLNAAWKLAVETLSERKLAVIANFLPGSYRAPMTEALLSPTPQLRICPLLSISS